MVDGAAARGAARPRDARGGEFACGPRAVVLGLPGPTVASAGTTRSDTPAGCSGTAGVRASSSSRIAAANPTVASVPLPGAGPATGGAHRARRTSLATARSCATRLGAAADRSPSSGPSPAATAAAARPGAARGPAPALGTPCARRAAGARTARDQRCIADVPELASRSAAEIVNAIVCVGDAFGILAVGAEAPFDTAVEGRLDVQATSKKVATVGAAHLVGARWGAPLVIIVHGDVAAAQTGGQQDGSQRKCSILHVKDPFSVAFVPSVPEASPVVQAIGWNPLAGRCQAQSTDQIADSNGAAGNVPMPSEGALPTALRARPATGSVL